MEMVECGTQFKKDKKKFVTYSAGGMTTTIDYLMIHKQNRKFL